MAGGGWNKNVLAGKLISGGTSIRHQRVHFDVNFCTAKWRNLRCYGCGSPPTLPLSFVPDQRHPGDSREVEADVWIKALSLIMTSLCHWNSNFWATFYKHKLLTISFQSALLSISKIFYLLLFTRTSTCFLKLAHRSFPCNVYTNGVKRRSEGLRPELFVERCFL